MKSTRTRKAADLAETAPAGRSARRRSPVDDRASMVEAKRDTPVGRDAIERRAYELYLERCTNGGCGDALADWLEAERQLLRGTL